ncbi:leucyl aminopeptidase [Candidatus Woesearchaeota archaeon]|nr:MAG: leucyl aminopeptidase [Candidatus Woesearchaeota archaeon]
MKLNKNITGIKTRFFYDKVDKEYKDLVDGKYGTLKLIPNKELLVCLGKKSELNNEKLRKLGSSIYNSLKDAEKSVIIKTPLKDEENYFLMEGLLLSTYEFNKYKSEKKKAKLIEFYLDYKNAEKDFKKLSIIVKNVFIVRDLINEPPSVINPKTFADIAKKLGKELKITVIGKKELEKKGAGGIIAVGQGARHEPRLLKLEYTPLKKKEHIAIVGKGVTFDSGGYNLKPTGYIEDMKMDMGGAATTLSIMLAASELKVKKNLIAYIPLVENMVSSTSYYPGDIIKMANGKTVEIANTDAEGRMILSDALFFAQKEKPELILDFATLTGAVITALGHNITAVVTNKDELYSDIFKVSKNTGEKVWQLPLYEEHEESVKGELADFKNLGWAKGAAGTITAAALLKQFVNDTPWMHFDIAGTAYSYENKDYFKKGGTGTMVRTVLEWINSK